ncbi:RING finger ETP1 [Lecanosticta acicola]|uniref:RING finger ETP1 n=1 Tax=Lecanosticta acicola TaxID=111012 RepID=A0AAI8Z128_9PEZI|nr:RING finger ETP1 [Lecanosticta acicola]
MPSYFFHLKFELYSTPGTTSSSKQRELLHSTNDHDTFVPPPSSDIFKAPLPAHKTSKWKSYKFAKTTVSLEDTTSRNGYQSGSFERSQSPAQRALSPPSGHTESHGDALLLPERSLRLKTEVKAPSWTSAKIKHSNEAAARDWRYDAVEIESIDMESSKSKSKRGTANGGLHTKAVYWPSDPKTTEVGWGVVHLYRDTEESSMLGGDDTSRKGLKDGEDGFNPEDCTTLCILAVPSWMMPSDLLGFVGDQAREDVSHFRLIRTGRANKYMVLMKFRSAKKARDWQKAHNGRLFSAAEPENCHVVFIKSVEFLSPDEENGATISNFPHNTNDPFTAMSHANSTGKSLLSKPLAPPPPNLMELPTCPVCLERMDETTGLLTILCQHVFHCACLEKWRGSGCPVCRYTHSPSYTFPYPRPDGSVQDEDAEPLCSICARTSNLWVCLICGNIGCGRYDDAHAYAHYEATSHCYAMDINTQHVWDYAGDGYVHRLIQSKPAPDSSSSSRGTIDLSSRTRHENEAFRAEGGDSVPREKMESMAAEYTYLLTSQLEGQRRYFEEQVERAVDKASQASARAEEAGIAASKANAELEEARAERQSMSEAVSRLESRVEKSEKSRAKFEQMARQVTSQLREEKTMNEGLMKRIQAAEAQAEEAKKEADKAKEEKRELEEMNHDLTMFISSQEKVKELQAQGEEVIDGSVSLPDPPPTAGKKKGKGKKK